MLFITYSILFSCFGKWDLICENHQCRILTGPTLVGHVHGPRSWDDLVKILTRSLQDCFPHAIILLCAFAMV